MKKRLLLIGMILTMSVSVSACGSTQTQWPAPSQEAQEQETPASAETDYQIDESLSEDQVKYLDDLARQTIADNNCDYDLDGEVLTYWVTNFPEEGYASLHVSIPDPTGNHQAKILDLYADFDDNIHYFSCDGSDFVIDDGVVD